MQKIGFFGGSFDPIHFGHLNLAKELAIRANLEQILFCPAKISPHKQGLRPTSIAHRLNMVALAIEKEPLFSLLNIEAEREGPSYTVDTLRLLIEQEKQANAPRQIVLILTDELILDFERWKEPQKIVSMVPLLVGSRFGSSPKILETIKDPTIREAMQKGWHPTNLVSLSSTELRQQLVSGVSCDEWIPQKVLDYIAQNKLYSNL